MDYRFDLFISEIVNISNFRLHLYGLTEQKIGIFKLMVEQVFKPPFLVPYIRIVKGLDLYMGL